ncbi:hypothetical protein WJX79_002204 [Trebouxia sp. C0005]
MGGGNGQKSATARARKEKEEAKRRGAGSQLKQNAAAQSVVCQICRASFMCTASATKLQEHVDSKHSKNGFAACFPEAQAA